MVRVIFNPDLVCFAYNIVFKIGTVQIWAKLGTHGSASDKIRDSLRLK